MAMGSAKRCVIRDVHLTVVVCVIMITRSEVVGSEFRLSDNIILPNSSVETLALDVCIAIGENPVECMEQFLSPPEGEWLPPELQVTGRLKETVMYNVTPSDSIQLVLLVPDDGNPIINYMGPGAVDESVYVNATKHYTFWTAAIATNGTHSAWREGPRLGPWSPQRQKEYIIQIDEDSDNSSNVRVDFKWSSSGDIDDVLQEDTVYTVGNRCLNKKHTEERVTIRAGKVPFHSISLSPGDICTLTVIGPDGNGTWEYDVAPQPAENITVFATPSGAFWDVRVSWERPARAPHGYQVALEAANHTLNVSLPGNATSATFYRVPGPGRSRYKVTVTATVGDVGACTDVDAFFPSLDEMPSFVPILSSLLPLMLILTSMLAIVTWCRRRSMRHFGAIYDEEDPMDYQKKLFSETISESLVSEDCWEVRPEKLLLHEVIGEGAFGVVRRGMLAPNKEVAVKMLKEYPSRDEIRSFRAEMELMKSVGPHPHVVSLLGCCSGRRPLLVVEYCSRGDLLSYLRCSWDVMVSKRNAKYYNNNSQSSNYRNDLFKSKSQLVVNKLYDLNGICDAELTYVDLLSFCRQIAMGMEFLASNRVVHRDLAARNILVTSDRTLKIADFGLSRDIYQENQYKQKGNGKMPVKWMALESLTRRIYTTQSDVWSFGVVSWEVVTLGAAPYPAVPPARLPRLLRAGYRMPRPAACCEQLYELMLSCWRGHPRERPTFADLHATLDAMLHGACAEQYLALDFDTSEYDMKPEEMRGRYTRFMEFARGKRHGSWCEALRPHNHYSSPPVPPATPPAPAPLQPICT